RGNNAITTGSPWSESGGPIWSTDEIWAQIEPHLDRHEDYDKINSEIHQREAMKWIRENPGSAALLSLKKALILWTIDTRSIMGGTFAYISIYIVTLASLLAGIYMIRKKKIWSASPDAKAGFSLMILWCLVMTLTCMVFFPLPRFQVLLVGIYFPVIGFAISELIGKFLQRSRQA
ncbi:MAG: hypothetical protein Q8896_13710, partial [Bacteroidota bacterium]|nr:hypothetical protein [Bacteroidota bacterium]